MNMKKNRLYGSRQSSSARKHNPIQNAEMPSTVPTQVVNIAAIVKEEDPVPNPNHCAKCNKTFKRISMHKCSSAK